MGFRPFGQPFGSAFGRSLGQGGGGGIIYRLLDQFTTPRAAGSVNGTPAEPTGQTRTVVDTGSLLTITGGEVKLASGSIGAGDPGLWYSSFTRSLGTVLIGQIRFSGTSPQTIFGSDNNQATTPAAGIYFITGAMRIWQGDGSQVLGIATFTATTYQVAIVYRATSGIWAFIKGGAFTFWTLLWVSNVSVAASQFPCYVAGSAGSLHDTFGDNPRIPINTYVPAPLAYDTFTRSNGALGSTEITGPDSQVLSALVWNFTIGVWTISTNKAIATPTLGADAIVNGGFAADTDWTKGAGWSIAVGLATAAAASSDLSQTVPPLTVGRWYQVVWTISGFSLGTAQAVVGGVALPTHGANGTYTEIARAGTTACLIRAAGYTGSVDNVSANVLTTAELFASVLVSTADVIADVAVTLPSATGGVQAGLVLNLDSTSSPANFIICYLDGRGNCVLEECVAGTYATKQTTAITYSAGAVLRVERSGTECRVFYNNAAVGAVQTMTANVNNNHGLFSTSALNSLDGFTVWARGTTNEYSTLDNY